ncbi:copper transporter [Nocardioides alcanivorans]|uniref:copper transporter n=1 Tax=Nocardioides alcanivorans TaxID=2897352 RepID=UPI001F40C82B|nr:copper transporter [Nocardioides alcanivorans]
MISFRQHVVSLVAVLVALAAGVALGGGPLSDIGRTASPELRAENDDLRADLKAANGAGEVADELLTAHAAKVAAGTLKDLRIALVTLPGAPEEAIVGVDRSVRQAGGTVVATYGLEAKAYDASGKSLVDTLGSQLADGLDAVPAEATTYERLGAIIAAAIVGADDTATSVTSSLTSAELITVSDEAAAADLVVVIAGRRPRTSRPRRSPTCSAAWMQGWTEASSPPRPHRPTPVCSIGFATTPTGPPWARASTRSRPLRASSTWCWRSRRTPRAARATSARWALTEPSPAVDPARHVVGCPKPSGGPVHWNPVVDGDKSPVSTSDRGSFPWAQCRPSMSSSPEALRLRSARGSPPRVWAVC